MKPRGPGGRTSGHLLFDELVLGQRLHGDGVHAVATADVAGVEPVDLQILGRSVQPAEEVVVLDARGRILPRSVLDTCHTPTHTHTHTHTHTPRTHTHTPALDPAFTKS